MTSSTTPNFATVETTDNKTLPFDSVVCVSQNHTVNNGDIFEVAGGDKDTLHIKRGKREERICAKTLILECEKRDAHFLPLFNIEAVEELVVHSHGLVTLGKRYGHDETMATHGKDALLVSEAKVTLNSFDFSLTMQGCMSADGECQLRQSYNQLTNITDGNPLVYIDWSIKQDILNQIMGLYQQAVSDLDTELRDKILAHIDATNPMLRFDCYHIEDLAKELYEKTSFNAEKQYSEYEIQAASHIIINNYDEYMPAYRVNHSTVD
jgi:hypothetical protein